MPGYRQLKRRQVSNAVQCEREIGASEFIPYFYHYDKETLYTKRGEMVQIVKVDGFSFETADDEDIDMKKMVRNSLLKSMAEGTFAVWFHMIRRRQSVYPGGKQPVGFADYVDQQWRKKHHSRDTYINEMYVSIVRKEDVEGAAQIESWFKFVNAKADQRAEEEETKKMHKELHEVVYRVLATLKDYGARVLTVRETENGPCSEPIEFLAQLVNCGERRSMLLPTMDISKYLATSRIYFGNGAIEVRGATRSRMAALVSIKEYAPATAAGLMDAFLQLPMEFIVSQSFTYHNRQTNIGQMQRTQRRMMAAADAAISQVAEISDALDMAMSGHVAFGIHHLTVLCIEENLQALEKAVSMAVAELVNIGINPVRERLIMEQCYWAQLPGNFGMIGRRANINTLNLASFASLHNYPVGKISGNHWGECVTVFDTTSGTPYFFNYHLRDVGHTTIIGPTGSGKTVLMNFLTAQSQKYHLRTFLFDKDRGSEIFIRALRGKYTHIQPGEKCNFNPLHLPDTMENRNFLAEWVKSMVSVHDEPVTAEDSSRIAEAIAGNYKLDKKDRMLRNIAPFLGLEGPGTLAGRLRMWHSDGQYAGLFDNDVDVIDFSSDTVFGFEMGDVLQDRNSLGPVLLYLFHRIHLSLDGTPTQIVLDEAWALIDNKIFAGKIKDWLKTLRKLNGMVVFATQSVEDAVNSSISDTLIQQTASQIFLPNPKATEAYKRSFMLSDREFNLLKTTDPGSRYFLLKQGKDVVVARIDLSGMEDVVNILSGRAETVVVLDEIREAVGDDPEAWIPLFQERLKK